LSVCHLPALGGKKGGTADMVLEGGAERAHVNPQSDRARGDQVASLTTLGFFRLWPFL